LLVFSTSLSVSRLDNAASEKFQDGKHLSYLRFVMLVVLLLALLYNKSLSDLFT
jgi:hypothetical protein